MLCTHGYADCMLCASKGIHSICGFMQSSHVGYAMELSIYGLSAHGQFMYWDVGIFGLPFGFYVV